MPHESILTRGEIISEGLQLGGNPGLTTRTRVFLNLFLDHLYRAHDWSFLEKEDTSLVTTVGSEIVDVSAITDLDKPIGLWQEGDIGSLIMTPWSAIWSRLNVERAAGTTGRPTHYALDTNGERLIIYPIPNAARPLRLLYQSHPAQPAVTPEAAYDALFPLFPDSYTLVNAVSEFARRWDTDSMFKIAQQMVDETMQSTKMADMKEGAANALQLKLDPAIHRTFDPDFGGFFPGKL